MIFIFALLACMYTLWSLDLNWTATIKAASPIAKLTKIIAAPSPERAVHSDCRSVKKTRRYIRPVLACLCLGWKKSCQNQCQDQAEKQFFHVRLLQFVFVHVHASSLAITAIFAPSYIFRITCRQAKSLFMASIAI